jgi:hypothetical protein
VDDRRVVKILGPPEANHLSRDRYDERGTTGGRVPDPVGREVDAELLRALEEVADEARRREIGPERLAAAFPHERRIDARHGVIRPGRVESGKQFANLGGHVWPQKRQSACERVERGTPPVIGNDLGDPFMRCQD